MGESIIKNKFDINSYRVYDKSFKLWKKQALNKLDKSTIGEIDSRIRKLCDLINDRKDMFTLSSCSGRICLLDRNNFKKNRNIWLYVTHDKTDLNSIKNTIIKKDNNVKKIEFRQESSIIHISVNSFNTARKLMHLAKESGFNQTGIIAFKTKIVVELICDAQISIPIYDDNLLVNDNFLKYVINYANKLQEISWNSIQKLENKIIKFDELK